MRFLPKVIVLILCLLPFLWLGYRFATDQLSANPLDDLTDETGVWTLRFIVITLAITPLRTLTGWSGVARFRRMAGDTAFFYGTLHLLTYLVFDKFFDWGEIAADIQKRKFILAGFTGWAMMFPLAVTSFDRMQRLLGGKQWKRLHRLTYAVGVAGVIHYLWLVKIDIHRPLIYGAIVGSLLLFRAVIAFKNRRLSQIPRVPEAS